VVDATGSRLGVGSAVSVVLLGQMAIPPMIHASLGFGHVSEASAEGKTYVDIEDVSSTSVSVTTMVLVQPAAAASAVSVGITFP
jgi:hypothetical protein